MVDEARTRGLVPRYLHPDRRAWDANSKIVKAPKPDPKSLDRTAISEWVEEVISQLDAPEVLIPEINCNVRSWDNSDNKCKLLIQVPVEYSASIANMGVAIIYDIINNKYPELGICERAYYPEPKLKKRLLKKRVPLFSKESRRSIKEFDIIAFSSFYPLQLLAFPELLELGGISCYADERTDEDPIVLLAGVSAFNPQPVHNVCDAAVIGEGEEQVLGLCRIFNEEKDGPSEIWSSKTAKEAGWNTDRPPSSRKFRILVRWATELQGVYVYKFYEEKYFDDDDANNPGQVSSHEVIPEYAGIRGPNGASLPRVVNKALVDLDEVPPLTKMLVSNSEGEAMSAGSLMIAASCSNKCYFCQGSYISQPYRERSLEAVKAGFTQLIQDTGAHAVTPYAFNLSDHSLVNEIIYFLMGDENRKVSMSSQRIDYFSPDFAKAAFQSGNRSITLAIEGGSQRLRDVISKNLTEGMILEAFRTAFEIGFLRIKIYMIANLPTEDEEDRYAIVHLLRKIQHIQREVQGDHPKTQIRVSYTPFTSKNCTPFQWANSISCDRSTGFPIMEKTLKRVVEDVQEMGYRFRVGTNTDLSIVNQCITHGDRRLAPVLMAMYRSSKLNYAGGMSVGKGPLEEVQKLLRRAGLDYEYFLREKDITEVFPWDFINTGVTKDFLREMWVRSKDGFNIPICFDDCTKCGACTKKSAKYFQDRKDGVLPLDRGSVSDALNFKIKPVLQKMRLKIRIPDTYRFVHGSKIKMHLRRAAFQAGLPVKNEFVLASDKIAFQDWLAGADYAEVGLFERVFYDQTQLGFLAEDLTGICGGAIIVDDIRIYSDKQGNFRRSFDKVLYEVFIPAKDATYSTIKRAFRDTLGKKSFIVKIKQKGLQRDSWTVVKYEARPHIHSMTVTEVAGGSQCYLLLSDKVGPYELLPAVFRTSKRRILSIVARRVDMLENVANAEEDMFATYCGVSGKPIERNLFDDPISEDRCAEMYGLPK